jgi:hypothetical protein
LIEIHQRRPRCSKRAHRPIRHHDTMITLPRQELPPTRRRHRPHTATPAVGATFSVPEHRRGFQFLLTAASAPLREHRARYLFPVETIGPGELVRVAGRGPDLDGIVFDIPSHSKVVVAVVEPGRGPTFRTVHPAALTQRAGEGADDRALRLLLGRTPSPVHDASRGGGRSGRGRPGHTRAPTHRTTGR